LGIGPHSSFCLVLEKLNKHVKRGTMAAVMLYKIDNHSNRLDVIGNAAAD